MAATIWGRRKWAGFSIVVTRCVAKLRAERCGCVFVAKRTHGAVSPGIDPCLRSIDNRQFH